MYGMFDYIYQKLSQTYANLPYISIHSAHMGKPKKKTQVHKSTSTVHCPQGELSGAKDRIIMEATSLGTSYLDVPLEVGISGL